MSTPKQIRKAVYQWASRNGITMNKKLHRELWDILMGKVAEDTEHFEEDDPNIVEE
jgi:hypothetical protein